MAQGFISKDPFETFANLSTLDPNMCELHSAVYFPDGTITFSFKPRIVIAAASHSTSNGMWTYIITYPDGVKRTSNMFYSNNTVSVTLTEDRLTYTLRDGQDALIICACK